MEQQGKIWGSTVVPGAQIYENMSALCVIHTGLAGVQTFLGGKKWNFFFFKDIITVLFLTETMGLKRVIQSAKIFLTTCCSARQSSVNEKRWKSYLWAGLL